MGQNNRRNEEDGDPIPIFNRFVIQLLMTMFIIEFVKGALLLTILPVYMGAMLGLSTSLIGWSLALQYVGDNVFRSPMGWVIDRVGYRYSMLISALVTFSAVSMIAVSTHIVPIITACALLGVGTSPVWPCVISGATAKAGKSARGRIMSVVYMAWLAGVGSGPIVINFFVDGTYRYAFQLLIGLMAVVILNCLSLPSKLKEHHEITYKRLIPASNKENKIGALKQYFAEVKQSITISKLMFPAMFMQTFALGLLTPVLTLYARAELHLSPIQYSGLLITGGLTTILLLIPVGKMVDKWGTQWFLNLGFGISSSVLLVFSFVQFIPLVYILVGILGIGYALIIPAWSSLIAAAVPSEKRGAVWGLFLTIEGSGMVVGPIVSGNLWDRIGPPAPFIISGSVLIILLVVHIFISAREKNIVQ